MLNTMLENENMRLGFGCSGVLGKGWFSEDKCVQILRAAIDAGIVQFDTAGFYGQAEQRLGRVLKNFPTDSIVVSTKTGTRFDTRFAKKTRVTKDFSKGAIIADVEASLKRLHRERLDILYLHGPNTAQIAASEPVFSQLKAQGKIRYAGVCGHGKYLDMAAGAPYIDVVMGTYNLLNQSHGAVFAKAKSNGKTVVSIAPLMGGLYRKGLFFPTTRSQIWYLARALARNRADLWRAQTRPNMPKLPGQSQADHVDQAGQALSFVLENKNIDTVLTTTTREDHLQSSIAIARQASE